MLCCRLCFWCIDFNLFVTDLLWSRFFSFVEWSPYLCTWNWFVKILKINPYFCYRNIIWLCLIHKMITFTLCILLHLGLTKSLLNARVSTPLIPLKHHCPTKDTVQPFVILTPVLLIIHVFTLPTNQPTNNFNACNILSKLSNKYYISQDWKNTLDCPRSSLVNFFQEKFQFDNKYSYKSLLSIKIITKYSCFNLNIYFLLSK